MDKRLELTEKQKEIIARYNNIIEEMEDAKIICTWMEYEGISAINGENVSDQTFPEDECDGSVFVNFSETEYIKCPFGLRLWYDDKGFNVTFD